MRWSWSEFRHGVCPRECHASTVTDFRGTDRDSLGVFLSDNASETSVQINIHVSSRLYRFQATKRGEWTVQPVSVVACSAAVPVLATRHRIYDTLVLQEDRLHLVTSDGKTLPIRLPDSLLDHRDELPRHLASTLSMGLDSDRRMVDAHTRHMRSISHAFDSTASIEFDDGETARISVDYRIRDELVHQCLDAIAWSLSPDAVFAIKRELLFSSREVNARTLDPAQAWTAFVCALKTSLGVPVVEGTGVRTSANDPVIGKLLVKVKTKRKDTGTPQTARQATRAPELGSASLAKVLYSLHLVAQDCRLTQSRTRELDKVAGLIVDLCRAGGEENWLDYWSRLVPGGAGDLTPTRREC